MRMRILACWPYARRGWIAPLEGLRDRGHEVIYLAYRTPDEEPCDHALAPERPRLFWRQFANAHELLRKHDPDRVVLMGTEGAWHLAVLAAARRAGIPTAVLQHGLLGPHREYEGLAPAVLALDRPRHRSRLPAVSFLVRTLRHDSSELLRALRYLLDAARSTAWVAGPRHPLATRRADAYLAASASEAEFFLVNDHVGADRVHATGLPELDGILGRSGGAPAPRSVLLIDTPHTGGPHGAGTMSGDEKAHHLARLGHDLAVSGRRLTVKLHPDSYSDRWPDDSRLSRITLVRDADLLDLITAHEVVIGFESTLLIAALHHRPGLLIRVPGRSTWLMDAAAAAGAVPEPPLLAEVSATHITDALASADRTAASRRRFVEGLVGPADGRALDRVEQALVELTVRD